MGAHVQELEAFVTVVQLGGFTAAAKHLGVPKSTISRRVAAVEQRVGCQLLHRTTRSVRTTDLGQAYFERVERIIADLAQADADLVEHSAQPFGTLRVTAPSTLGNQHLSSALVAFAAQYPDVHVQVHLTDRIVNLVDEGFDVAIRAGHLTASTLKARRLRDTGPTLVASPAYLSSAAPLRTATDLMDHACLVNDSVAFGTRWPVGTARALRVPARLTANSWEVIMDAALVGLGVAFIPDIHVDQHLAEGRLVRVLPHIVSSSGGLWVVYPPSRYLSPSVRAFVDHMVALFGA